jgi:hypothetical protein
MAGHLGEGKKTKQAAFAQETSGQIQVNPTWSNLGPTLVPRRISSKPISTAHRPQPYGLHQPRIKWISKMIRIPKNPRSRVCETPMGSAAGGKPLNP